MKSNSDASKGGRHFLQIPGPSNLPERISRVISQPTIDHRGPDFARLTLQLLERLRLVFKTSGPVITFPSSGSGAWEAALVNTLSPGDRILLCENGHFADLWGKVAARLDLDVDVLKSDWGSPVDAQQVEARLAEDREHAIKALIMVHNETSTGVTNDIAAIRRSLDASAHPALLLVDAVSSLAAMDYRHDEWGVDVTVAASQKGLMLPPGLSFNAVSAKALQAAQTAGLAKSYWDWQANLEANEHGFFPYTPATNLLFGLDEALNMLLEEGLEAVFARHRRLAAATRQAVEAWGLEVNGRTPTAHSATLTAVLMPKNHDADALRTLILKRFDMSLGTGLGQLKGKAFRIGHLGNFNDLMLAGTLCGIEMGLNLAGVPHQKGGVGIALDYLARS